MLIPKVLSELKDSPVPLFELYGKLKPELNDVTDFLSVMDCLYALRAADINEEGNVSQSERRYYDYLKNSNSNNNTTGTD